MARCRFVQPQAPIRLSLSEGDWIEVKRELSTGERRRMFTAMRQPTTAQASEVDVTLYQQTRTLAYVVAWSFLDPQGAPAPVSVAAYDMLQDDTAQEIHEALDAHETQMARARAEEKKRSAASTSPTSPSAGSWAGATPI
jgi:hypothetical protein